MVVSTTLLPLLSAESNAHRTALCWAGRKLCSPQEQSGRPADCNSSQEKTQIWNTRPPVLRHTVQSGHTGQGLVLLSAVTVLTAGPYNAGAAGLLAGQLGRSDGAPGPSSKRTSQHTDPQRSLSAAVGQSVPQAESLVDSAPLLCWRLALVFFELVSQEGVRTEPGWVLCRLLGHGRRELGQGTEEASPGLDHTAACSLCGRCQPARVEERSSQNHHAGMHALHCRYVSCNLILRCCRRAEYGASWAAECCA